MSKESSNLYFGGHLVEYEDVLIGDREGLEQLKNAIDEAIEVGESSVSLGEFIGVKCLPSEKFNEAKKSESLKNTLGSYIAFGLIGFFFILTVLIVWLAKS